MKLRKVSLSVGAAVIIGAGVALSVTHGANAQVGSDTTSTSTAAATIARSAFPGRFGSAVPSVSVAPGKILNATAGYKLVKSNFYNPATSANWSGYVTPESAGTYNDASTGFKVPAVSCAKDPNSAVSFWPGIDGVGDQTVEQLGITAYCSGTTPQYFGWVEEYPNPAYQIDLGSSAAPVKPGDVITAEVTDTAPPAGTEYEYTLTDATQNWQYQQAQAMPQGYTGQDRTSEVIAEAPTNGDTGFLIPLADFTTPVAFTNSAYNSGTAFSSSNSTAYNIADDGEQLDSTGAVDSSGDFDVTYQNSDQIAAPTGLSASTDNISIGWKAVSGATKYEVKIDGPNLDKDGTVNADQTHAIYYDIANGTFKYQVRAINAAGDSAWTAVQSVTFNNGSNSTEQNSAAVANATASVPGAPATPTGLSASTDNISIGWKAIANAEQYQVAIDGPNLDKTGSVNADQTHAIYYDIAKGTFKYEVRAFNVTGYGPWTAVGTVVFNR
jgi:hypothetical protein